MRRLVVIGAGPIGLAAAMGAIDRGYEVTVLERGEVGAALERWGPVRFFTPLSMNLPPALLSAIGHRVPHDALLTGPEMRAEVLEPLVATTPLRDRVRTNHRVMAIGRRGMTRIDFAGHPLRAERPFILEVECPDGELTMEADMVFDATGGYVIPNAVGSGGVPARGERRTNSRMIRDHATLDGRKLHGRRVLLIGHGHSAANALLMLEAVASEDPATRVVWAVRTANRRPCAEIAADPLPERDRVVGRANSLAENPPHWLRVERRAVVESLDERSGGVHVTLSDERAVDVDAIASFTGFRPDSRHLSELPLDLSPVTEGGARLYRAIANVTDCLTVPAVRPSDLESGEPGFYLIGSRAYGRARTFLLQTGLQQLETILDNM
jgi:thioredoxin reductase